MFIKYRTTLTPALPVANAVTGIPLSNEEIDGNFKSISNAIDNLESDVTNINAALDIVEDVIALENDGSTATEVFPVWATGTGTNPYKISTAKLRYVPSTDTLIATRFQGTADFVTTNANLTGMVTSVGNATTVVVNAALTGEATSNGVTNAVTLTNSAVIGKLLTGYSRGAGNQTVLATDSIIQAIQKVDGNNLINAAMTGEATSNGTTNAVTLTNSAVIGKVLTGYAKGSGTVIAADSILQAIQKLDGNADLKANIASPTFTGTPAAPTASADTNTTQVATTAFVLGQAGVANPLPAAAAAAVGTSARYARQDHVHRDIRPAFRSFRNTSNQTLSSGVDAVVSFQTKSFDTGSTLYDTSQFRWTPGIAGFYQINAGVQITGTGITAHTIQILVDGSVVATKTVTGINVSEANLLISDCIQLTASNNVSVRVNVTGTTPVVAFGSDRSYFSGSLVSIGS